MLARLCLLMLITCPAAMADECERPASPEAIPDGATASESAMLRASQTVREFVDAGQTYVDCLDPRIDLARNAVHQAQEGTEQHLSASRTLLVLVHRHDEMVEKMQSVAGEFNAALRAYRNREQ